MEHGLISEWQEPRRLALLAEFFDTERNSGTRVPDEIFLARVREAFWPTNVWCYLQEVLAITSHACSLRANLAPQLLTELVDPMLAGGFEEPEDAGRCIDNILAEAAPYVPLSTAGRRWLEANIEFVKSLLVAELRKAIPAGS
ncbi:MAG TPA: hypothetical protein VHZ26_17915 [Caulobacteraceae bacterium]|jgi:hypothetical protein|nr:hypothetical protein [Caulobacteraceae bacterium]